MEGVEEGDKQAVPTGPAQEQDSTDGSARPAAVAVNVHIPQVGISVRPNLWHNWARIALRAEARAIAALRDGLKANEGATYVEAMTLETMVAVTAVRSSFHHLYLDWYQMLGLRPKGDEPKVPERATTDIPTDPDERRAWMNAIKTVVKDRDEIIHEAQESTAAVPHPLGTNTSALDAYFVPKGATEAVDVMLDFYYRVFTSPTAALQKWAADRGHVLKVLEEQRTRHLNEY